MMEVGHAAAAAGARTGSGADDCFLKKIPIFFPSAK
jgi:hypothetical protein